MSLQQCHRVVHPVIHLHWILSKRSRPFSRLFWKFPSRHAEKGTNEVLSVLASPAAVGGGSVGRPHSLKPGFTFFSSEKATWICVPHLIINFVSRPAKSVSLLFTFAKKKRKFFYVKLEWVFLF